MANKRVSLKGKGADLFFGDYAPPTQPTPGAVTEPDAGPIAPRVDPADAAVPPPPHAEADGARAKAAPRPPRKPESKLASLIANDEELVRVIRKTVRVPGREVSFVRLSAEEKAKLGDIVYHFKRKGRKLTETEISRIAVNILVDDYERHGDASLLARILDS